MPFQHKFGISVNRYKKQFSSLIIYWLYRLPVQSNCMKTGAEATPEFKLSK